MIRKPFAILASAAALAAFCGPAFADPDGVKVGRYLIVSPVEAPKALETWDLANSINQHNVGKAGVPGIWTAREPREQAQSDWHPAGLVKIAYDKGAAPVIMRLWTRKGGAIFVKDIPAESGAAVSYKINVGHDGFVLNTNVDGTVHVGEAPIGQLGKAG
jgi:hypothetical protein